MQLNKLEYTSSIISVADFPHALLNTPLQFKCIAMCIALAFASNAFADEVIELPEVNVSAEKLELLPSISHIELSESRLIRLRSNTSDSAKLLDDQPGVSLYGAGGVSSMPIIHGLADDRIRIKVDGMDLISACANHMNPPLSYIDPTNVSNVKVFAGITPVSVGGDSIGGTIIVDSVAPEFAQAGQEIIFKGQATTFYRSNNNAQGINLSGMAAGENVYIRYTGSTVSAQNYTAGDNFKAAGLAATGRGWLAGDEVGSSSYKSQNHALAVGLKHENHLLELKLGVQNIPEQGFPNQRMDMTDNDSKQINFRYTGDYQWGGIQASVYHERTRHSMNFGGDKQFWYGNAPGMPMETEGNNTGALLKSEILISDRDILRIGAEYQRYRLDDWWPASGTGMMMSPNIFWNINNGQRDRYDVFAEWEAHWNSQWVSQLGLRSDTVKMNAGAIQGYNNMGYGNPTVPTTIPGAFNAAGRQRTDHNVDLTALARFTPDAEKTFEVGYAMKTRSPNLYERFAWSNNNTMVMNMNNWVGDGNGYVGNLNLKPEVAHTLSVSGSWHDSAQQDWSLKVTPYYTHVEDYIDAVACSVVGKVCPARTDGFVNLSLANQTARLYGVDVSGQMSLVKSSAYGSFSSKGLINYVNGKNLTTGDNLYNIMPLNLKLAIEQHMGNWTNSIEAKLVNSKTDVQAIRKELKTAGYGLLNLYSSYDWKQVRFDIGIENLLNKYYANPLGGAYVGQGATMMSNAMAPQWGTVVPGMGRSINTSLTVKF
jgi:iron complex outermembrane recepter protein